MKLLSLFSGIGGFDLAFNKVFGKDHEFWFSEIDPYAIQVYTKQFPNAIPLGDINNIDIKSLPKMDFIVGGSPCQDLSIAKRDRQGLDGSRSGLFWKFVEIVQTNKPKYFILENVNSMPKEAKQIITDTLGVEPIMINASLVSAQNRKRLFWTNIPNVTQPEDRGILLKDILENGDVDRFKSYAIDANYYKGANLKTYIEKSKRQLVFLGGLQKKDWVGDGKQLSRNYPQGNRVYSPEGKSTTLASNGGGLGAKTGLYLVAPNGKEIILGKEELQVLKEGRTELGKKSRQEIRKLTGKDSTFRSKEHKAYFGREGSKANCITTGLGVEGMIAIIPEATKKGYAIAREGQSIDMSFPTSETRRGRVGDKVKNLMTSLNIGVLQNSIIRKLTPVECARLQGFPDDWCDGLSNTRQYRGYGNAVNVEVVKHIFNCLKEKL